VPSGATAVAAGQTTTVQLSAAAAQPGVSVVHWSARGAGLTVTPSSGQLEVGGSCPSSAIGSPPTVTLTVGAAAPGSFVLDVTMEDARGTPLPPVTVDVQAG